MNTKLIATFAALAIAAPLMGCAGETDAPEQRDGLTQKVQTDSSEDADQKTTSDEKTDESLRQAEPNTCEGNAGEVGSNPCWGCFCFPY